MNIEQISIMNNSGKKEGIMNNWDLINSVSTQRTWNLLREFAGESSAYCSWWPHRIADLGPRPREVLTWPKVVFFFPLSLFNLH